MENSVVKTGWNIANIGVSNTPKTAKSVGQLFLYLGLAGAAILAFPASMAAMGVAITLPVWLAVGAKSAVTAAGVIKLATQGFGTNVEMPDGSKIPLAPIGSAVITPTDVIITPEAKKGIVVTNPNPAL